MRPGVAFKFIPELLGDVKTMLDLSKDPKRLYIASGVETIKAAGELFVLINEKKRTKEKEAQLDDAQNIYEIMCKHKLLNYEEEVAKEIELKYQEIKNTIIDWSRREAIVFDFAKVIEKELSRIAEIMKELQSYTRWEEFDKVDEVYRRAIRDYNRLIAIITGEES